MDVLETQTLPKCGSATIKPLLNSIENKNCKKSVMLYINKQIKNSITITPFNILDALKNVKCGKSSGIDFF